MPEDLGKCSTGLKPNVAALLSYIAGFVSGIVFLVIEKENKFVRFHALQSIITFGAIFVLQWVFSYVFFVSALVPILSLGSLALWVILMIKSYQGEKFKLPVIGDIVEKNQKVN
jgi:uncharacterized membrane protein